ncbi:recombinase family protein [Mycobacteroides chelonae]|uniref:recombinase family protein n=1 Tax=Mycobacteroides chelonae TaxID=1774 RepID=UPI001C465168|nr:recombinase family protein [Mycobacteroides chelonae]MBV6363383.1 recombinase family protein [Mycobacteroides chelonae]
MSYPTHATTTTTATIGYARVSTDHQSLDQQRDLLLRHGVAEDSIYEDKLSGRAGSDRPGLTAALSYLRGGDTLVVAAMDRLGRSVAEVTTTIADLHSRGVVLHSLRESVDTSTPTGRAVISIMASLAELELELGKERRAASRDARLSRGLPATKPPKLSPRDRERMLRLYSNGEPLEELLVMFGVGRSTFYRYLADNAA